MTSVSSVVAMALVATFFYLRILRVDKNRLKKVLSNISHFVGKVTVLPLQFISASRTREKAIPS